MLNVRENHSPFLIIKIDSILFKKYFKKRLAIWFNIYILKSNNQILIHGKWKSI